MQGFNNNPTPNVTVTKHPLFVSGEIHSTNYFINYTIENYISVAARDNFKLSLEEKGLFLISGIGYVAGLTVATLAFVFLFPFFSTDKNERFPLSVFTTCSMFALTSAIVFTKLITEMQTRTALTLDAKIKKDNPLLAQSRDANTNICYPYEIDQCCKFLVKDTKDLKLSALIEVPALIIASVGLLVSPFFTSTLALLYSITAVASVIILACEYTRSPSIAARLQIPNTNNAILPAQNNNLIAQANQEPANLPPAVVNAPIVPPVDTGPAIIAA